MKINTKKTVWWFVWIVLSLMLSGYYGNALLSTDISTDKSVYLSGKTTDGHYQIELKCDSCHTEAFAGKELLQKACLNCHKDELKKVEDSHPKSKFTDPRNADILEILDARYCVTCHIEHRSEKTRLMGVTMPEDYCFLCHQDVGKNRPSHKELGFETCDDAGCHNYHDNKALYEDFLVKHMDDKSMLEIMALPQRNLKEHFVRQDEKYSQTLSADNIDMPPEISANKAIVHEWEKSTHAKSGVNCSACHVSKGEWIFKPTISVCKSCHEPESKSFFASKHGMRLGVELPAMKVSDARIDLKNPDKKILTCNTCHTDHSYNTEKAAIDACLGCHQDEHSKAFRKSKHFAAYQAAKYNKAENNTGLTCASCHMPRLEHRELGEKRILVDHNQSNTLRPNEKMVRAVCLNCHGLKFSLEALADSKLIKNNFNGSSRFENEGFAMAKKREELKRLGLIKDDDD